MHLEKPPVEEVGIDFQFDPSPEKQPWSLEVASPFLEQFEQTLPICDIAQVDEIRIVKRSSKGVPQKLSGRTRLDHVIVHDVDETRFLRLGDDTMGYRIGRCGGKYPGFKILLNEALEKFQEYILHFQPTSTRRAQLRYIDAIDIPRSSDGLMKLEDYFRVGIDMPDTPFGPVGKFAVQCVFPDTQSGDALQLNFYNQQTPDNTTTRFIMEWHSLCENIASLSAEVLISKLDKAHVHMVECFKESFTEQGLSLFGYDPAETQSI